MSDDPELTSDVKTVLERHRGEFEANSVIGNDDDPEVVYSPTLADPVGFVTEEELAAFFIGVEAARRGEQQ